MSGEAVETGTSDSSWSRAPARGGYEHVLFVQETFERFPCSDLMRLEEASSPYLPQHDPNCAAIALGVQVMEQAISGYAAVSALEDAHRGVLCPLPLGPLLAAGDRHPHVQPVRPRATVRSACGESRRPTAAQPDASQRCVADSDRPSGASLARRSSGRHSALETRNRTESVIVVTEQNLLDDMRRPLCDEQTRILVSYYETRSRYPTRDELRELCLRINEYEPKRSIDQLRKFFDNRRNRRDRDRPRRGRRQGDRRFSVSSASASGGSSDGVHSPVRVTDMAVDAQDEPDAAQHVERERDRDYDQTGP